jgi:RNA polymerase sigma factor (sigma-70 family)
LDRQTRQVLDLLESMGPQLANLLTRLTLRKDAAQELLQDLFLKLWRSPGLAQATNPQGYVYRAAVRLGLDWRRARKARPDPLPLEVDPAGGDRSILGRLIDAEDIELILDALNRLDELCRYAFVMRWVQEQPYEVIAAHLGRTPHQVRGLCHWALKQLRESLQAERSEGKEDCHVER